MMIVCVGLILFMILLTTRAMMPRKVEILDRSVLVHLPEPEMLKLVRLAKADGVTLHELAAGFLLAGIASR